MLSAILIGLIFLVRGIRYHEAMVLKGGKILGPWNAPIVIEEFSDFQCPACRNGAQAVDDVLKRYPNDIQVIFYHFPLKMHAWAMLAHQAAECANRQGKFWPYYHLLYGRQKDWSAMKDPHVALERYARELGMNDVFFDTCVSQGVSQDTIAQDVKKGQSLDIHSTPTFFINGRRVGGFKIFLQEADKIIKEELAKKSKPESSKVAPLESQSAEKKQ
ncbi:MAG: thioredoxin domain-containing protein [Chlamydiae bacterium]|nr:thioredoxin domain-containing protein [Chlamydiota bacterium]